MCSSYGVIRPGSPAAPVGSASPAPLPAPARRPALRPPPHGPAGTGARGRPAPPGTATAAAPRPAGSTAAPPTAGAAAAGTLAPTAGPTQAGPPPPARLRGAPVPERHNVQLRPVTPVTPVMAGLSWILCSTYNWMQRRTWRPEKQGASPRCRFNHFPQIIGQFLHLLATQIALFGVVYGSHIQKVLVDHQLWWQ